MAPDLRKYIWDAKEAAARALRFTAGKSLDDYVGDELLRSAVERQFLILGEALGVSLPGRWSRCSANSSRFDLRQDLPRVHQE
ncbi:HepT-like ribonuclease domain-containing protein [Roseateles sp. P5_D6]